MSISSTILTKSSKLIVDYDNMGSSDLVYSLSELDFWIFFSVTLNFAECRYYRTFIGPYFYYFLIAWGQSNMVRLVVLYVLCMQDQGRGYAAMTVSPLPGPFIECVRCAFCVVMFLYRHCPFVLCNHFSGPDRAIGRLRVYVCVWTITFERNDLRRIHLAYTSPWSCPGPVRRSRS